MSLARFLLVKVLIVDDDRAVRGLLKEIVKRDGSTPVVTSSGVEGYAALVADPDNIGLILLDLSMPEMDGFRFREMQLEDPTLAAIPVVVLTGYGLTTRELDFMRPAAVLVKPASVFQIREAIRAHAHPLAR